MRRIWLIFSQAVTVFLALGFVVATLKPQWLAQFQAPAQISLGSHAPAVPPDAAASRAAEPQRSLRGAAQRAAPAVVSISASKTPRRTQQPEGWQRFHRFGNGQEARPQVGLGSGVIVSEQGYLLTNAHVVAGASEIEVRLSDGRQARAALVGSDPETDLAVLKINLDKLPVIALGATASLQVGDSVLAIGNPFDVGQTVTAGIVSALGRNQLGISTFENFIQTDAAINPGNSGGALVDAEGRLIGINTAIYSNSGGSLGIGFAIPIDAALQVMQALLKDGLVARGWIGVQTRELTPEFIEAFKLSVKEGVLISAVVVDAPAAKAGIKPGDVVTQVANKTVRSPAELLAAVAALTPKSQAAVAVQRGSQALVFQLAIGQRPLPQADDDD
ncbi:S1C family serine protease [Roseateles sp.]|uniref:S1C family serine protease n=1 Tax=Roseateles sp. TaxID=1971397 RepID=UPI0037C56753